MGRALNDGGSLAVFPWLQSRFGAQRLRQCVGDVVQNFAFLFHAVASRKPAHVVGRYFVMSGYQALIQSQHALRTAGTD